MVHINQKKICKKKGGGCTQPLPPLQGSASHDPHREWEETLVPKCSTCFKTWGSCMQEAAESLSCWGSPKLLLP